jgi:hypothetical protein
VSQKCASRTTKAAQSGAANVIFFILADFSAPPIVGQC